MGAFSKDGWGCLGGSGVMLANSTRACPWGGETRLCFGHFVSAKLLHDVSIARRWPKRQHSRAVSTPQA